jgi:hypothetical protein
MHFQGLYRLVWILELQINLLYINKLFQTLLRTIAIVCNSFWLVFTGPCKICIYFYTFLLRFFRFVNADSSIFYFIVEFYLFRSLVGPIKALEVTKSLFVQEFCLDQPKFEILIKFRDRQVYLLCLDQPKPYK